MLTDIEFTIEAALDPFRCLLISTEFISDDELSRVRGLFEDRGAGTIFLVHFKCRLQFFDLFYRSKCRIGR